MNTNWLYYVSKGERERAQKNLSILSHFVRYSKNFSKKLSAFGVLLWRAVKK